MGEVIEGDFPTVLDIPAEKVLHGALSAELDAVVVIGFKDDILYFARSYGYSPDTLWALELAKQTLMTEDSE
jgi:hypothetical protein